ncbi:hypothetical protein [Nitrosomonas ureae]|uniref:Integrase catalytic domain-containing protein n=1 Tax=Nitrosomonas ureae TaxID=44577 RepID=A0A2T5IHF6_9PROT|nr:hypothetical protein [Nitrosomonas ureae]PTQ83245.1 hypothetical protein C8R28_102447 [Nitrosomonas ureae]
MYYEREFAGFDEISKQLDADFYFAHPYASWERGTNENTDGLIRQYFPKKQGLHHYYTTGNGYSNGKIEQST